MVVALVPSDAIGASGLGNKLSFLPLSIPLTHVEQIVKTSGNLFASFLIQGGGFKFYQGSGQASENYIIKAKLVGNLRFHWKNLLEHFRENGKVVMVFASSFGFDTGFIINSLEVNVQNRERSIFNCTISLQKIQQGNFIPKVAQGLILSALDTLTDNPFNFQFGELGFLSNRAISTAFSTRFISFLTVFNDSYKGRSISNLPNATGNNDSELYYKQTSDEDYLSYKNFGSAKQAKSDDQI